MSLEMILEASNFGTTVRPTCYCLEQQQRGSQATPTSSFSFKMNITLNSDCSEITITSDILLSGNTENTLVVTYNGGSTELTIAAGETSFTLVPSDIAQTDTFSDGVYSLHLTCTLADDSISEDLGCAVPLCTFNCSSDMFDMYNSKDYEKIIAFSALKIAKDCLSCSCDNLITFYNILTDNDTNPCGTCSCQL